MQLYAYDSSGRRVFVANALRGVDYACMECGSTLRLRGGTTQRAHFFHFKTPQKCRLALKSAAHLAIQQYICQAVEGEQEMRFEEIRRIADVAYPAKKLIFEVQCSFIAQEEMAQRTSDYRSIGWEVVWILHDAFYKKKECPLPHQCHYFATVMGSDVIIYDKLGLPYKQNVDLTCIMPREPFLSQNTLPQRVTARVNSWNDLFFSMRRTAATLWQMLLGRF